MKKLLTLLTVLAALEANAQEVVEAVDSIDVSELEQHENITQHSLYEYQWVDTCTARYAVVHAQNGACGLYDLQEKKNITELEYYELWFSKMMDLEDGTQATMFFGKSGLRQGIVSVGPTGSVMSVTMDNPDLFLTLDSCKTIDQRMTKKIRNILKKGMSDAHNQYGQILVMDTQTGQIKTWVTMKREFGKAVDSPIRKYSLSAMPSKLMVAAMSMIESKTSFSDTIDTKYGMDSIAGMEIRDHNWRRGGYGKMTYWDAFKQHSDIAFCTAVMKANTDPNAWWSLVDEPRASNPMYAASVYNVIASGGKLIEPSVNSDSVRLSENQGKDSLQVIVSTIDQLLKEMMIDGIGSKWIPKKANVAGDFVVHTNCRRTLIDPFVKDEESSPIHQIIFTGYLPADNPRYTICVSMERDSLPAAHGIIGNIVANLAKFLQKQ